MTHTNYRSGATQAAYIVKCRTREQRAIQIAGGAHRRGHYRRVRYWSKWYGVRYGLNTLEAAHDDMMQRARHAPAPFTEFGIFYKGKRVRGMPTLRSVA